jgi:hypothetical protein
MKIHPVGAELCHADRQAGRQADTTKLIADFSNFANAPKNGYALTLEHKKCAAAVFLCNS